MKKIILPLVLLFAVSGTLMSQGFYLRAGTGYGAPVATTQVGEKYLHVYTTGDISTDTYSTEVVTGSYGSGMNFNVAAGYKFNANFIFDLNVEYIVGNKIETSDIYKYVDASFPGSEQSIYKTNMKGFFFNPSFIFSAGFGKAAPYGRFGVVIASPEINENESYYYDLDGTTNSEKTWVYKNGMGLGYQGAIGMNWKIAEVLDFYTELNFVSMTYYPTEGEMTKYIVNGSDYLVNLSVSQKQISFEKSYDPQAPYNPDVPQVQSRKAYPLSSVSAQVGVRFTLWKKAD